MIYEYRFFIFTFRYFTYATSYCIHLYPYYPPALYFNVWRFQLKLSTKD